MFRSAFYQLNVEHSS